MFCEPTLMRYRTVFCSKNTLLSITSVFFIQKYASLHSLQKYTKILYEYLVAMLNYCLSYECWSDLPSLMQAWIRIIIPSLFVCCAAKSHQRLIMFIELFIVLRSLSALWALGFAALCFKAQLPNPLRVLSKTQLGWIMNIPAVGLIGSPPIILDMGYWLLAIGYGLEYAVCRYPCLSPLTSRLIASSPHHLNL